MAEGEDIPEVGPWAAEKLERLGRYLEAYMTVMAKVPRFRTAYIDAFAGAGIARVRAKPADTGMEGALFDVGAERREDAGEQRLLAGSPRVALSIARPFDRYRFVERDPERLAHLHGLGEAFPERKLRIIKEDCNTWLLRDVVTARVWKDWRGVVFLDPFGMQVPWDTLVGIAATGALEVILNFPMYMATQRLVKRSATFTEKERAKLDAWFGDPGWYDVAFRDEPGLLGPMTSKRAGASGALVEWYCGRLRDLFKFVEASPPIVNSRGGPLYHLIHATHNETGHKIGKHVMNMALRGR